MFNTVAKPRPAFGSPTVSPLSETNAPNMGWLDDETNLGQVLLTDLRPDVHTLAEGIMATPGACHLLDYLWRYPRMAMTESDLAHMVGVPEGVVAGALRELEWQGVARVVSNGGRKFYALTSDADALDRLRSFCTWRERWEARLRRLSDLLHVREFRNVQRADGVGRAG